jgi:hypothetical protein
VHYFDEDANLMAALRQYDTPAGSSASSTTAGTSGPYTLPGGATLYHLGTVNGQSINSGASATTISLTAFEYNCSTSDYTATLFYAGDCCILMKSPT